MILLHANNKGTDQTTHPQSLINCSFSRKHETICIQGFANNKGADKPALPRSLISYFVIR